MIATLISFLVGLIAGLIVGFLFYRNNAKKMELLEAQIRAVLESLGK